MITIFYFLLVFNALPIYAHKEGTVLAITKNSPVIIGIISG